MILSIALMVRFLFRSASFELGECQLVEGGDKIRTTFVTRGETVWGSDLVISGTDYFWFGVGEETARIVRHESIWEQTADEITKGFLGR